MGAKAFAEDINEGKSSGFLRVALAVVTGLSWMAASSCLILVNKHILSSLQFPYPMTVSGMGMMGSGVASFLCCRVFKVVEATSEVPKGLYMSSIIPVGFFMAVCLYLANEVYLHLTVAFIQMLRSFSPVILMAALVVSKLEEPSRKMVLSILIIAFGTAMAAYGELHMSVVGILLALCNELSESMRMVMTQFMLVGLKFNPIEGLMYIAPACTVWLLAGALVAEVPHMMSSGASSVIMTNGGAFLLSACLGFVVNALAYGTIKLASSLTLKVLGTVRNTLLVVVAVVFMGEGVTLVQGMGYLISLVGFVWYNMLKMNEIAEQQESRGDHEEEESLIK